MIESVVFAGMKPGTPGGQQSERRRWLGPLRRPVERWLSGGPAPSDPLYLSNRTPRQRLMAGLKIAVPLVVVAAVVVWSFRGRVFHADAPASGATRSDVLSKLLP